MAVSNAIGSNVFDILVCLGLPWFIETTMVTPGRDVVVHSKGGRPHLSSLTARVTRRLN
jgi:Ca2+/Na+ antiporter